MSDKATPEPVPRSEVERAVAEAVAAERRKRQNVQLTLVAAVLLLLAVGGAFARYAQKRTAAERSAQARVEIERNQAEAERARLDADQRLRTRHSREGVERLTRLAADLRRGFHFAEAEDVLRQAETLAGQDAPDLAPAVRRAKADLAFVRGLDEARLNRWVTALPAAGSPATAIEAYLAARLAAKEAAERLDPFARPREAGRP